MTPVDTALARRVARTLREPLPLGDALATAAAELRDGLGAVGVALVVRRDGRATRGQAGAIRDDARGLALGDASDATLLVSPEVAVSDEVVLVVGLALEARFLAESAQTDGLTGVANRRTFDARIQEEWSRAARERTPLALAILDLDYFKVLNDRLGHPAGDDALRRIAHAASATLQRAGDRFARYGGEEFAAILPATPLAGGIAAAERIRAAIAALAIPHPVGKRGRLTVSIGVAALEPAVGGSPQDLIAAADRELYRAKGDGRDRVAAAGYAPEQLHDDTLPQPFAALVGRDDDVALVSRGIDVHRVVTIAGIAGVGKTRLALAVAHDAADRFAHVRFVDALGAASGEDVLARIAAALGVVASDDLAASIRAAATEPTLVVLDGCERVADGCRDALDALTASALRFVATSRVPLGARDERVVRLAPLDAAATRALFLARASAADVLVNPDDEAVTALLRRVGGSPLAIELVVARLATTTPRELLDAFGRDERGADADGSSLGALLRAALGALAPDEAVMLAGVSAFHGTFSASDAASVVPLPALDTRLADTLLRRAAARSLLDAASHDGITRWRMIDPVREALLDAPHLRGSRQKAYGAHISWCLDRLDAIGARAGSATNRAALMEGETLVDEVRAALDRALRDDVLLEAGARLCIAAVRQWFAVRHQREGRTRAEAFLDRGARIDMMLRVKLHTACARLAFVDGDLAGVETHARAADALLGDQDVLERSPVLNFLGIVARFRGDYDAAEHYAETGRAMNARIGNRRGEAIMLGGLGSLASEFRLDQDEALRLFGEAEAIFRAIHEDLNALVMQGNSAESLAARGDLADAAALIAAAVDEGRTFGDATTNGHLLCVAALIADLQGDRACAVAHLREGLATLARGASTVLRLLAFDVSGRIVAHAGDPALAAMLFGASERAAALEGTPFTPIQRFWREPVIEALKTQLGARFEGEVARGRGASRDDVLAALDDFLASLAKGAQLPVNTESATVSFKTYGP